MAVLFALIISAFLAYSAAEKEYDSLRRLGIELPSDDEMSHWQFTNDFLPDRKRRLHQRLMIICFVLLFFIPAIDSFFRK